MNAAADGPPAAASYKRLAVGPRLISDVRFHLRMRRVGLALVLVTAVTSCVTDDCSSPEAALRQNFESRKPVLEQLRRMSDEDRKVIRIAPTFTRLENDWSWPRPPEKLGFAEERWNKYRQLFREAGITVGIDRGASHIFFTTKACGLGVSGKSFGYAYTKEPKSLVSSLDAPLSKGIGFVPLGADWYMFVWAT